MEQHVFDEDYEGKRWQYGLTFRPPGGGAVPRGFIIGSHKPDASERFQHDENGRFRHGVLDYPRGLTAQEVMGYELTFVCEYTKVPVTAEGG